MQVIRADYVDRGGMSTTGKKKLSHQANQIKLDTMHVITPHANCTRERMKTYFLLYFIST